MLWIICILFGVALGQHLKVTASPELTAAIAQYWPPVEQKAIAMAQKASAAASRHIKASATKSIKASPKTSAEDVA